MAKKTGRLTKEEQVFITNKVRSMTPEEMANKLNRRLEPIKNYINKNLTHLDIKEVDHFDLRSRPYWSTLESQFSRDELKKIEYHWKEIVGQFNKDIIHTEELQILDVIKHEILSDRVLTKQRESQELIESLRADLSNLNQDSENEEERERYFSISRQIDALAVSMETSGKEHKTIQELKQKLFDKIKGSRDQRVSEIRQNKETFNNLVIRVMKDREFSEKCSLDMEKMRISMAKHLKKLGDYHTYSDNIVDRPILNSETVFFEGDDDGNKDSSK